MEHMVSCRQSHHIAGLFGTNVDWEAIPFEAGEAISGDPTGFGRNATRFVQNGGRVTVMMTDGIIPPPGGMVQILSVPVDESRLWADAIKAATPDTGRDWDIWKVGGQYPPVSGARPSLKQVIIANFGNIGQRVRRCWFGARSKSSSPRCRASVSRSASSTTNFIITSV